MPRIKITVHEDIRCARATHFLNGYDESGGYEAVADALLSDAKIDRTFRDELGHAIKRKDGRRFDWVEDRGRRKSGVATIKRWHELQCIADEVEELQREIAARRKLPPARCLKDAKAEVMKRRRIKLDKVKEALALRRRWPSMRLTILPET